VADSNRDNPALRCLQHRRAAEPHEAAHRRDPLFEGGDQLGLPAIEEPHLDAVRFRRARQEDLTAASTTETLERLDNDRLVGWGQVGIA
jgi:hypothetical protein